MPWWAPPDAARERQRDRGDLHSDTIGVSNGSPRRDCKSSSRYPVWNSPRANAGSRSIHRKKGSDVRMPDTSYSPQRPRHARDRLVARAPQTISFETSGS
jgi:hypothetical protein